MDVKLCSCGFINEIGAEPSLSKKNFIIDYFVVRKMTGRGILMIGSFSDAVRSYSMETTIHGTA